MTTTSSPTPATVIVPIPVPEDRPLYWKLRRLGFLIVGTLLALLIPASFITIGSGDLSMHASTIVFMMVLAYIWYSLREVPADRVAGAFFYGRALIELDPGLHFVPYGLMQVKSALRRTLQFQCPGEPETVFKGDDKLPLPEGMVRPIRVVTAAGSGAGGDHLNARMTLVLSFVVQYAVNRIFDYVARYDDEKQVEKQVRDIGESELAEIASTRTPAQFITEIETINNYLTGKVREGFQGTGVELISVRVISPDLSHEVSSALAGIPQARAKAEQVKVTAQGEKEKRIKEGEGAAKAEGAMLAARAKGRKEMRDALGVSGETVLAAEAASTLSDKTVILAGAEGGMRDVMTMVKGAQTALNTGKGGTTT